MMICFFTNSLTFLLILASFRGNMSRLPIQDIIQKYDEINQKLSTVTDTKEMIELSKEQSKLEKKYEYASKIAKAEHIIEENEAMITEIGDTDADMKAMMVEENNDTKNQITELEGHLLTLLVPSDPRDDNDILLEIRAGAGGDESALFAAELLKTYSIMAEKIGLKLKVVDASLNEIGGYKEVYAEIRGTGAFSWYKYESGVHRVQRVPLTEKQGRIHTSTISVAIMPLIEATGDFKLDPKEVELIVSTSSGKGGQSVNTTYSAVKLKHLPTGMEAQSQDERSQVQNKVKAMSVLTSRVADYYEQKRLAEEGAARREQVGKADRSEKIRTYNFPQDRLTDHRYNNNWNQLPTIMSGGIASVIEDIKKIEAEQTLEGLQK
jgi:peptide chain release factor 1